MSSRRAINSTRFVGPRRMQRLNCSKDESMMAPRSMVSDKRENLIILNAANPLIAYLFQFGRWALYSTPLYRARFRSTEQP